MGIFFSKKRKSEITEADRAVLALKTQRRKLTAERSRIEGIIEREVQLARELIQQKKRDRALLALKKKKLQEGQVEKIDAWLLNVEQVLGNIETAKQQNKMYDALKQGHSALTMLQKEVTLEDVEKLMEDTAEAKAYQDEMAARLGESLSAADDEAVEEELENMEAAFLREELEERLPEVPKHDLEAAVEIEETAPAARVPTKSAARQSALEEPLLAS